MNVVRATNASAASRTAVLVCQGRAVADGRLAPGHFHDKISVLLLTPDEFVAVERARDDVAPSAARERLAWERLRACAEGVATRTVLIDSAIRRAVHRQLVIIGAGLDARPWRMGDLAGCAVFCVDQPASQADCRQRVAGLQPVTGRLHWVPADLAVEPLGAALAAAGHDAAKSTVWLWEGVVPYLTRRAVHATVHALSERSAVGSTLIVHYQDRALLARLGRRAAAFAARHGGLDDPMADEPWRSLWTPKQMARTLKGHGFTVDRDVSLFTAASWIGAPTTHRRALANGHIAVATTEP